MLQDLHIKFPIQTWVSIRLFWKKMQKKSKLSWENFQKRRGDWIEKKFFSPYGLCIRPILLFIKFSVKKNHRI